MEPESNSGKRFIPVVLPWVVAGVALVLYLATLNHWVSIYNFNTVAKINGWLWQPNPLSNLSAPLFVLVTYPFHWLPAKLVPLALNLFSAVCAGLTLALLARSVALLPQNRTSAQRQRMQGKAFAFSGWLVWLPPVLAVLVCGLQLTFWEHATNASGQMFNLLLFAYLIRCLLEFRLDKRQTWLSRAALLYGAGMANSWAMVGFFPVFIAALIWIKGLEFFNLQFLQRMMLLGLAGLSLYLLLPIVQTFSHTMPIDFWTGLKISIIAQKNALMFFPKKTLLLIGLTSLLPILIISIRWKSYFGDPSPIGVVLNTLIFHTVHGFFLLACIWVAFDPGYSPRQMGGWTPFLTFYYLGALSVGYFSGYFLLIFGTRVKNKEYRPTPQWLKAVSALLIGILVLVSLLTPAGLIYKNLPEIRRTNGSALNQYASQLAESLPAHAVILSDDPLRLVLAEAALNRSGKDHGLIAINTQSMKWPKYHNYLHQQYGTNWPETVVAGRNTYYQDTELVNLVNTLSTTHPIYYLHPSFGYYFEFFYGRPHGLVLEMKPYPAGMVTPPPLTEAEIAENQTFWKKAAAESFPSLLAAIAPPNAERNPAFRQSFMNRLHLKAQPNLTATLLGTFYSHTLDFWGVEMQKAGRLEEAGYYFTTAQEFYPDNVVANINQRFNRTLRQGERTPVELTKAIEDQFGRFSSWQQVLSVNGPFDDPNICLEQSRIFAGGGLIRQSAIQLERVIQLAPDSVPAHMWLGLLYAQRNQPARALDLVKHMQARPEIFLTTSTNRTDLLVVQTAAMFSQNEIVAADKIIQTALRKNPSDAYLLSSVFQVSLNFNRYTNALAAVDGMLRITPDDSTLLANQGHLHLLLGDFTASIPPLTRALVLDTNNYVARLYRATSYLSTDKFDAAQSDFEILHKTFPKQFQITYGLGEVAYHKKDTNNAIRYYQACLADGGTNTTEAQTVMARLKELKGGKP